MQNKRIILCGSAACGKTFARDKFVDKGYKPGISYTTRKRRVGEIQSKDYEFRTEDMFRKLIGENFFFEWEDFGGVFYGTSKGNWSNSDIFIMEPNGINNLSNEDRKNSLVIYIDTNFFIRLKRMYDRKINLVYIIKRLYTDYKLFRNFNNYDLKI